jgi:acyl-CoA synthetase (AMP-forming)/AMP-acid ligase II
MQGTLERSMRDLCGAATCIEESNSPLSIDELLQQSLELRRHVPQLAGARVAVCGLCASDLVRALVALDGFVDALFLLPGTTDHATRDKLISLAGCTHKIVGEIGELKTADPRNSRHPAPEKTTWILATSGTSGTPKLVGHSFTSLTRTVKRDVQKATSYRWGLLYDAHRFAGLQVVLQALLSGSVLCLPTSDGFDDQVRAAVEGQVNALSATPTLWRKLLMDPRIAKLDLRQITLGGEIADQPILSALSKSFPRSRITHIYASTEAGTGFAVKDGKTGFPKAWLDSSESPVPLRVDERGHLCIKPSQLPTGEVIRRRMLPDGYLDTEDRVEVSGDRVVFLGRASGAINVGGNKVIPEHIEQVIRHASGVLDVRVYGRPNSVVGNLVVADVVVADDADPREMRARVLKHCRSILESWQVPAFLRFVDALAVSSAGKVERQLCEK